MKNVDGNCQWNKTITFTLGNMVFEYDEMKNQKNIQKHGISFKIAARVFLTMIVLNFMTKVIADRKNAIA